LQCPYRKESLPPLCSRSICQCRVFGRGEKTLGNGGKIVAAVVSFDIETDWSDVADQQGDPLTRVREIEVAAAITGRYQKRFAVVVVCKLQRLRAAAEALRQRGSQQCAAHNKFSGGRFGTVARKALQLVGAQQAVVSGEQFVIDRRQRATQDFVGRRHRQCASNSCSAACVCNSCWRNCSSSAPTLCSAASCGPFG